MCFRSSPEDLPMVMNARIHLDFSALEGRRTLTDVLSREQQAASLWWQPLREAFWIARLYDIWWKGAPEKVVKLMMCCPGLKKTKIWTEMLNTDAEHHFQWSKILLNLHTPLKAVNPLWKLSAVSGSLCHRTDVLPGTFGNNLFLLSFGCLPGCHFLTVTRRVEV